MNQFRSSLLIFAAAVLCCAGCAKHEMVKEDRMIPVATPAVAPQPVTPAVPAAPPAAQKDSGIGGSSSNESGMGTSKAGTAGQESKGETGVHAAQEKIFFDFDSSLLSPAARATLAKNAAILKQDGSARVRIEGNCDELGSDDYNLALGESRAKAAMNYLQTIGIAPARLSVISYGKEKPVDPGHDDAARAKNRRDEFVVTAK